MTTRLAICLGLTRLDPTAYDGWGGECPGCDRDAARFATLCHDAGFDGITVLLNQMADRRYVKAAFLEAKRTLKAGDLLVLYNSGHGGQQPDEDGDEQDGLDETLCWWSGEVLDDTIGSCLAKLRKGVRVLYVTDTCNSGTNYRGRMDLRVSSPVRLSKAPRGFRGGLVHFGGCVDGRYSYGDEDGGAFTNALLDAFAKSRRRLSYREWFDRAADRMPDYQRPAFSEWGLPIAHDFALE